MQLQLQRVKQRDNDDDNEDDFMWAGFKIAPIP